MQMHQGANCSVQSPGFDFRKLNEFHGASYVPREYIIMCYFCVAISFLRLDSGQPNHIGEVNGVIRESVTVSVVSTKWFGPPYEAVFTDSSSSFFN